MAQQMLNMDIPMPAFSYTPELGAYCGNTRPHGIEKTAKMSVGWLATLWAIANPRITGVDIYIKIFLSAML